MVIFQNEEDKSVFIDNKIINENQSCKIKGSGIDLHIYRYTAEPHDDPVRILFTARMLRDKGAIELVDAANLLKERYYHKIQFLLIGDIDNNPKALSRSELESMIDDEYIKWLGYRTDIRELLEQSHIFAFPSYYREGLPKSLIEASAVGRPIVTTNSTGCKDCVIDGYNGFLVPIRDSQTLAERLELLINDKQLRITMGINSRKIAERDFSIDNVVEKHLVIYNKLISYGENI